MISIYEDNYENFGWRLEDTSNVLGKVYSVVMRFKRNRKIINKTVLTRLQRNFDACISEITRLESSKYMKAAGVAYAVGVVGTTFMAGSVFAVTSGNILLCVILAIPAMIGWVIPYWIYRAIEKVKTAEVTLFIDQKYDELYAVCEKAHGLLEA
ncbi:hypothetical protein FACS1894184_09750 [Clostridia bacterium]|nr:hypothetical protein FACS1894184_09750 [Clostridia bacterium]